MCSRELNLFKEEIHKINKGSSFERGNIIKSMFPDISLMIIKECENIMNDMLILPGTNTKPFFVGNPPKWVDNPVNNNEYTFSLNRLTHLSTLSEAYSLTQDEKYAKKVLFELENWIDNVKCPEIWDINNEIDTKPFEGRSPWRALEVGIRGYRTLPLIIELTIDSQYFTDDLFFKLKKVLKKHIEVLFNVSPLLWPKADHNHYLMENLGLMSICCLFKDLDIDGKYLNHSQVELDRCLNAQITEFGGQIEGCPSYHNGCVYWFGFRNYLAHKYNLDIPSNYNIQLDKMFKHSLHATRACGGNFPWGDSHTADKETLTLAAVSLYMATGERIYLQQALWFYDKLTLDKDLKDNLWRIEDLNKFSSDYNYSLNHPLQPVIDTLLWDKSLNHVYYRTSWEKTALSLMAACRVPVKNRHAHMDPGGFDLTMYGKTIISDPGIYTYKDDEYRHMFKSTAFHNCATINCLDAWEYLGSWAYGPQRNGNIKNVSYKEKILSIDMENDCYFPAILQRKIVVVDDLVLVIDFASPLSKEQTLTVFFHIDSDNAIIDSNKNIKAKKDELDINILSLFGQKEIQILNGKISPVSGVWIDSKRVKFKADELMVTGILVNNDSCKNNFIINVEEKENTIELEYKNNRISVNKSSLKASVYQL